MNRFIQLHLLTSYPPANLNRDDLGRPKTATMGGTTRLRISSQSLKRAWRSSDAFEQALANHIGTRTKEMGVEIYKNLLKKGVSEKNAADWAKKIAKQFGKLKTLTKKEKDSLKDKDKPEIEKQALLQKELEIEQLAHFSPEERSATRSLEETLAQTNTAPTEEQLKLLQKQHTGADIAMFGRMLASSPAYNTEASVQVAHAISVHKVAIEDDFFTAVDDLNLGENDQGAAHMGELEFAAGLFYLYVCIDRELLLKNLSSDQELANKTIAALIEVAATIAPTGKQNSFASRARASYLLCEKGSQQPRSLSVAFLSPVTGENMLVTAIDRLNETIVKMDKVYGKCAEKSESFNVETGEGTLEDLLKFATGE